MSTPIYYQFPLSCLAYGESPVARLDAILSYCRIHKGLHECHANPSVASAIVVPSEIKTWRGEYPAWVVGAQELHLSGGDFRATMHRWLAMAEHCKGRTEPFVRIRNDWFWNCLDRLRGEGAEKPLSYDEFAVICALLSKIGTKRHAPCTWREIQRRALGYTTEALMRAQMWSRKDHVKPLSRQRIRTLLDRLETNRFFARGVVYAGKAAVRTHYSFSMKRSELMAEVATKFGQRRSLLIKTRRRTDREISAAHAIMQRSGKL